MTKLEAWQIMKEMNQAAKKLNMWVAEVAWINGDKDLWRDCQWGKGEMLFDEIGVIVAFPSRLAKLKIAEVVKVLERGEQRLIEMNDILTRELNKMTVCA